MQKFVKRCEVDGLPAIPVIAGISATPERFQRLIGGTGRVQRPVDVPADEVRASGLLKDFIDLRHPSHAGTADLTLLKQAAVDWHKAWQRSEGIDLHTFSAHLVHFDIEWNPGWIVLVGVTPVAGLSNRLKVLSERSPKGSEVVPAGRGSNATRLLHHGTRQGALTSRPQDG